MKCNIYLNGVGGQGIGVLSELVIRAYDDAGFQVKGVDTHGLAQRGGSVESHIRIGYPSGSPLIEAGKADIVLSLELTEAYRALYGLLRDGGHLAYFDTLWQSLPVRLEAEKAPDAEMIGTAAAARNVSVLRVGTDGSGDVRMQNIMLLAESVKCGVLPGIAAGNIRSALIQLFSGEVLEKNLGLLESIFG